MYLDRLWEGCYLLAREGTGQRAANKVPKNARLVIGRSAIGSWWLDLMMGGAGTGAGAGAAASAMHVFYNALRAPEAIGAWLPDIVGAWNESWAKAHRAQTDKYKAKAERLEAKQQLVQQRAALALGLPSITIAAATLPPQPAAVEQSGVGRLSLTD